MGGRGNPYRDPKTGQYTSGSGIGNIPVDYNNFYNIGFGVRSTTPNKDGFRDVETEDELIALRRENERERMIQQTQEEARTLNAESKRRDAELKKQLKIQKIQSDIEQVKKEIQGWEKIQRDRYGSPYLKEKSAKELQKLRAKLDKLNKQKDSL